MAKQQPEKTTQVFDESFQKSLTHTRPDPKTQAPHSRPATGSNGQSSPSSSGGTKKP